MLYMPPDSLLPAIRGLYIDHRRHYHTWVHITYMLSWYERFVNNGCVEYDPAHVYAIWFHDAVYVPMNDDNEVQSIYVADDYLNKMGVEEDVINEVQSIILDTAAPHKAFYEKSRIVIDLDLLAFSEDDEAAYRKNQQNIRREFAHIDDKNWLSGRAAFLSDLLKRSPFYYSDFLVVPSTKACRNILRELNEVKEQLSAFSAKTC